jgi:hypothetical protein
VWIRAGVFGFPDSVLGTLNSEAIGCPDRGVSARLPYDLKSPTIEASLKTQEAAMMVSQSGSVSIPALIGLTG